MLCRFLIGLPGALYATAGWVATASAVTPESVCLFTSFRDAGQKYLRFLHSFDGYHWTNVPGTFPEATVGKNEQFSRRRTRMNAAHFMADGPALRSNNPRSSAFLRG